MASERTLSTRTRGDDAGGGGYGSYPGRSARGRARRQPLAALAETATTDSASRGARLGMFCACLIAGATTVIEVIRDEHPGPTGEARHECVAFLLGRRADASSVDAAVEHEAVLGPPEL